MADGLFDTGRELLGLGGSYYAGKEGIEAARGAGELAFGTGQQIGQTAADMAKFQPYTVTGSLATGRTTPEGGLDLQLSPEELARQQARFGQAEGLFGQVGVDPAVAQRELYEQIRSVQRPEEERERLRMQEGLFSSGRGGISQAQYGGSNQEQFGFDLAQAEARNRASLGARTQALAEQQQALGMAGTLTGQAYMPQQQAIGLFGAGATPASFADASRRQQGSLYGQSALAGLEGLLQGEQLAGQLERQQLNALLTGALGSRDPQTGSLSGGMLGSIFDYFGGNYGGDIGLNPTYVGRDTGGGVLDVGAILDLPEDFDITKE